MKNALNQTEAKLLAEAQKRGGSFAVDTCSGKGSQGGRVKHGARERNAVHSLAAKGLVRIMGTDTSVDHNRGYAMWYTTIRFHLV